MAINMSIYIFILISFYVGSTFCNDQQSSPGLEIAADYISLLNGTDSPDMNETISGAQSVLKHIEKRSFPDAILNKNKIKTWKEQFPRNPLPDLVHHFDNLNNANNKFKAGISDRTNFLKTFVSTKVLITSTEKLQSPSKTVSVDVQPGTKIRLSSESSAPLQPAADQTKGAFSLPEEIADGYREITDAFPGDSDATIKIDPSQVDPKSDDGEMFNKDYQICSMSCGITDYPEVGRNMVVRGSTVANYKYPWIAKITLTSKSGTESHCGGSILNSRNILTAAHCFRNEKEVASISVLVGRLGAAPEEHEQQLTVDDWLLYEDYKFSRYSMDDIALLYLPEDLDFKVSSAQPVCLAAPGDYMNHTITITGWGATSNNNFTLSPTLQEAVVPLMPLEDCITRNALFNINISESQVCADVQLSGSCSGDSGSPMLLQEDNRWYQLGIVSFGVQCTHPYMAGVFTRVSAYHRWIMDNIKPGSC